MAATRMLKRVVVTGMATVAVAVAIPATAAHADPLCNLSQNTWVRTGPGTSYPVIYTIPAGGGFRLDVYSEFWEWELGHGNGQVSGWIPNDGRIAASTTARCGGPTSSTPSRATTCTGPNSLATADNPQWTLSPAVLGGRRSICCGRPVR